MISVELTQPLVVRFMQRLVEQRVVQDAVNPVDAVVREDEEAASRVGQYAPRQEHYAMTHKSIEKKKYVQPYSETSS